MKNAILLAVVGVLAAACASKAKRPDSPATHYVNLMLGGTIERADGGGTVGGTYEHSFKDKLGLGAFSDVTFGDGTVATVGPGVFFHPAERWTVLGGLGVEFGEGDSALFARVGGWYEFPQKTFTIAPAAWLDFGLGDLVAFLGVNFGWRF